MDLVKEITCIVEDVVKVDDEILAVFLLGSAVDNRLREDSDIDLAILMDPGKGLGASRRMNLISELSFKFTRIVDIGEISSSNLIYAREALLKGIPVYMKDSDKVFLYRANLLGMYIQYNLDRKEVLNAYRA